MVSWLCGIQHPEWHVNRFDHFCRTDSCDQDTLTDPAVSRHLWQYRAFCAKCWWCALKTHGNVDRSGKGRGNIWALKKLHYFNVSLLASHTGIGHLTKCNITVIGLFKQQSVDSVWKKWHPCLENCSMIDLSCLFASVVEYQHLLLP